MPTTVKIRRSGTASATPSALEHGEIAINYADGKVFWKNASNVITSFTFQSYALASHTHSISDVTGLQTALDGKASSSHTHGNISNAGAIGSTADQFVVTTTSGVLTAVSAATARTTLGVQPTASPAFTGAATFENTGNVVPVTVTNAGTANSFVVNDASGDTTPFVIDASGNVGVGTASPSTALDVAGTIRSGSGSTDPGTGAVMYFVGSGSFQTVIAGAAFAVHTGNNNDRTQKLFISSTGTATFAGQVLVTAGSVSACSVAPSGDPNTGLVFPSADVATIVTNGSERLRVDASGYVIISKSASGTTGPEMVLRNTASLATSNACRISFLTDSGASVGGTPNGAIDCINTGGGGASSLAFSTWNGSAIGERVRIDASGNVGIGTTSAAGRLHAYNGADATTAVLIGEVSGAFSNAADMSLRRGGTELGRVSADYFDGMNFLVTSGSGNAAVQRMRINAGGELMIGTTTDNGAYLLQVNSQIYATNATIATSDARFKTNVESLTDATSVIESLRPVAFDFIPQEDRNFAAERQVGLIAQEAQAALAGTDYADSVVAQCGDHLGLAYEKLVPVLIRALQESNARIAALEERING
jgi:hypothetical protein